MGFLSKVCFALAACLAASPAVACSVDDTYRVPTNLELTANADVILLARVQSGSTDMTGMDNKMTVLPLAVLKGNVPLDKPISVLGIIAEPRFSVLSNPLQLDQAHPLAYIGSCIRFMFVKDATVLFFLQPSDKKFKGKQLPPTMKGMMVPAGSAFSRWAEDVITPNSPWVRATRIYVQASALPKDQERALLIAERDKLRAAGDSEAKVIADDIERQLAGPNKPWNTLMREEIRKRRARGEDLPEDALKR